MRVCEECGVTPLPYDDSKGQKSGRPRKFCKPCTQKRRSALDRERRKDPEYRARKDAVTYAWRAKNRKRVADLQRAWRIRTNYYYRKQKLTDLARKEAAKTGRSAQEILHEWSTPKPTWAQAMARELP